MNNSKSKYYFVLLLFLCGLIASAQNSKLDSLLKELKKATIDTARINLLNNISSEYLKTNPSQSVQYAQQAIGIAEISSNNIKLVVSFNRLGAAEKALGNHEKALKNYDQSLDILNKILKDNPSNNEAKTLLPDVNINKGITLSEIGEHEKALTLFLSTLKIIDELESTSANNLNKNSAYISIGNIFFDKKKFELAIEYYKKALKISEEAKNNNAVSVALGNIGIVYGAQNELDTAAFYFQKQLDLQKKIGNKTGISTALGNLGIVFTLKKNYKKALEYQFKSLDIATEMRDKRLTAYSLQNIGLTYSYLKDFANAINYLNKSIKISKEINLKQLLAENYKGISEVSISIGNYKEASNYLQQFIAINDTLFNEKNSKQITEMQTKYETEKKEQQISLLNKESEIKELSIKKQKTVIYSVIGGLLLVILFAVFIFRALNITKKQKHIISLQKEIVEQKNTELGTKNKQIADSIEYAKNIQQSILPSSEIISTLLPSSFIFYQPKDVVSGDFYWMQRVTNSANEDIVLFAVIDCTGHGVPGAFVSLMAFNFIETVVNEHKIVMPAEILNELNKEVINVLRQEGQTTSTKYGMDMAIVRWNKTTNKIIYAGARNPMYIVSNNKLTQVEANRMTIGSNPNFTFVHQELEVKKNDMLYLFTDGYADQKGGEEGKKIYYPPFRELLTNIFAKNSDEQKLIVEETFKKWKGNLEQIDDVLVMGIKI